MDPNLTPSCLASEHGGVCRRLCYKLCGGGGERGNNAIRLTQTTQYPLAAEIGIAVDTDRPEDFTIALRIPAWAGPATRVTVNGEPVTAAIAPGTFLRLQRRWREGDHIGLTMDMPLRLEAVDAQHPNRLAVVQGPLALFAVGDRFQAFQRRELTAVRQVAPGAPEWRVTTSDGTQVFKPYFAVGATESTRLYQPVPV